MDLYYFLDFLSLSNASENDRDEFFRFAFDVMDLSHRDKGGEIKEHFLRDDSDLSNVKDKTGKPLVDLIFKGKGEVVNRIIPVVLNSFLATDRNKIHYGKISDDSAELHPNAKLIRPKATRFPWELCEIGHYNAFRELHIIQKIYTKDCEIFLSKYLPNVKLTKKAIAKFTKLPQADKEKIVSDLNKLNEFIDNKWPKGDFPITAFSVETGVDASDESVETKKDPKCQRERLFSIPNIGSVHCNLHIKISNTYRMHFHPDATNKIVYIPYIGKHLKTAKYR